MLDDARRAVRAAMGVVLVALAPASWQTQAQASAQAEQPAATGAPASNGGALGSSASLVGRVVFNGPRPERRPLAIDHKYWDGAQWVDVKEPPGQPGLADLGLKDESLIVGQDGGLANVVLWLRSYGVSPVGPPKRLPAVRIIAAPGRFEPHVRAFWIVRHLEWVNGLGDEAASFEWEPARSMARNLTLKPRERQEVVVREAEALPALLASQSHPWMRAYVLPLEHPYFAVSDDDGRFEIPSLPVGSWDFAMWHERAGRLASDRFPTGRFTLSISAGRNDVGDVRIAPQTLLRAAEGAPPVAVAANRRDPQFAPLHHAAMAGATERVAALLDTGADVNVRQEESLSTPLQYAAHNGHGETVQLLIDRGATVDSRDANGRTPLIWAAMGGHVDAMLRLLDAGADIGAANAGGWTALHYAAARRHAEAYRVLVKRGANEQTRNSQGKTPAEVAPRGARAFAEK